MEEGNLTEDFSSPSTQKAVCFCGCNWLTKHRQKVPNEAVQEQQGFCICAWNTTCRFLGDCSGSETSGQTADRFPLSGGKTEVCFWLLTVTLPYSCPACKASATPASNLRSAHVLLEGNMSSSAGEAKVGIAHAEYEVRSPNLHPLLHSSNV